MNKALLRRQLLGYRKLLAFQEHQSRSELLCNRVDSYISDRERPVIHVFIPIKKQAEPNIQPLIDAWLHRGWSLITSVSDFRSGELSHFQFDQATSFQPSKYGIQEPIDGTSFFNLNEIDVVLVPGVVFDRAGNRLGYGGGFYDRFLPQTQALKIGITLNPCVDSLTPEVWDIPVDVIINPFYQTIKF